MIVRTYKKGENDEIKNEITNLNFVQVLLGEYELFLFPRFIR